MLGWGRWLAIAGHRRGLGGASLGPQKGETRETHTKTKRKKFGKAFGRYKAQPQNSADTDSVPTYPEGV